MSVNVFSKLIRKIRRSRNARGQALLESVLLLSIITTLWLTLTTVLKKNQYFEKVFGEPWIRLSNEIEFGIPLADAKQAGALHPTSFSRHSTHSEVRQ